MLAFKPKDNAAIAMEGFAPMDVEMSSKSVEEVKQLGSLFVSALTHENGASVSAWERLLVYLEVTLPRHQINQLSELSETQHYIHRTLKHAIKHSEHLEQLKIVNRLSKLFPNIVKHYKEKELLFSYSYSDVNASPTKTVKTKHKRAATTNSVENATLYSYSPMNIPATYRGAAIRMNELLPAASKISAECSETEKTLVHTFPILPQVRRSPDKSSAQKTRHRKTHSTPETMLQEPKLALVPMLISEVQDEHFSRSNANTLFPHKEPRSPRRCSLKEGGTLTAMNNTYDVIQAFATGQLKAESESVYLNYTNSDRWDPYDLTVVPKNKTQPEHFVISKFGILRVYPDCASDFQSFADWLREASFYKLLRKIPFLKNYLLQRTFKQWYSNVRFAQYARFHAKTTRASIRFLPDFASALLKIRSLSEELLTVHFHELAPLSNYDQDFLDHALQGSLFKAHRLLVKYNKYCRRIVNEVIRTTNCRVVDLETEKRHKPFVSDLPLSIQKENHAQLERDLKAAQYQQSKLANFVCLVEHIMSTCIVTLSRQGAQSWVATALTQEEEERPCDTPDYSSVVSSGTSYLPQSSVDVESKLSLSLTGESSPNIEAFLSASFQLDKAGRLCICPLPANLKALISGPLEQICSILSSVVVPITKSTATQRPAEDQEDQHTTTQSAIQQEPSTRAAPPSMAPSRQPKSLLTILKGLDVERRRGDGATTSEGARSRLSEVTTKLLSGTGEKSLVTHGSPLETIKFVDKIKTDEVFSSCVSIIESALERVCGELDEICSQYSWLNNVHLFISSWEGRGKVALMSAQEYKRVLSKIHSWVEQVSRLPVLLPTSHCLLRVSTVSVVEVMGPQLATMLEQLTSVGMERVISLCRKVLEDISQRVEVLSARRYDLEGFAEYAHQLRECQSFDRSEADNIDYVLEVHNALLDHGVDIPPDDKALSMKLQVAWRAFKDKLNEAEVFVTAQTPIKAQGLQESIEACVEELSALVSQVNQGEFINPAAVPNTLLDELTLIQESVLAVRSRLLGLSKWKEAITGQSHDLSGVTSLMNQLYVRQELWKYRRVFDTYEREWVKTPFKKLDMEYLSQKVSDWLTACAKLEKTLHSDDPVLSVWRDRLQQFKDRIPLLQQLSSKALKTSHWCTIFASLGEDYNPDFPYTLVEFDLYKMYDHSNIIFEICHDAMQQEKLRAKVDQLQSLLEQKMISISQFPIDRYPFVIASKPTVESSRQGFTPQRKSVLLKSSVQTSPAKTTFSVGFQGLTKDSNAPDCLFTVEHQNQLSVWLEDTLMQAKVLMSSPHLGNLKPRGEQLLKMLTELREIVMMLSQCQNKWWELVSLFSQMDPEQHKSSGLSELQQGSSKYQEIMMSIRDDSRLLSLLGKRRGQKGFRDLQGEQLRQRLLESSSILETVLHKVRGILKESCYQFPRLYYLADKDVLRVLSNRGNPLSIMPLITRVFPAVKSLQLSEQISNQSSNSLRKIASKIEEGLQVMMVEGWGGEQLPLIAPLPLGRRPAPQWLTALEGAISYSLAVNLTDTLASLPDSLLGIITENGGSATADTAILRWMSNNLCQCVLLSLEVSWTLAIHSALLSDDPVTELKLTRTKLSSVIELVAELIRSLNKENEQESVKRSCLLVLQNVVFLLTHKNGILRGLLNNKLSPTVNCFHWRYRILYSTESGTLYSQEEQSKDHSATSSYSSIGTTNSKLAGKSSMPYKLHSSSQNLVASSKSLLSSRTNLLKAANESKNSGVFSNALTGDVAYSRRSLPTKCMVHCGDSIVPYGYEYRGPDKRLVLTPETEGCVLSVINSFARFSSCSLHGGPVSGRTETSQEIAKVVGRHFYEFRCSSATSLSNIQQLLVGSIQTGSLLVLDSVADLKLEVMILLGEWLQSLSLLLAKAFKEKKSSILLSEELADTGVLSAVDSTSTVEPLPASLLDQYQSFKVNSNQTVGSQQLSIGTLTSPYPSVAPSPLGHLSSNTPLVGVATTSSVKTSTPLPSNKTETLSQRSFVHHSSMSGRTSRATTRVDWYKMPEEEEEWFGYGGTAKEELEFNGEVLRASPAFGCVLISPTSVQSMSEIPQQLKVALRSLRVVPPDLAYISEILLLSKGFKSAHKLSRSFSKFWQAFGHQISSNILNVSPPPRVVNLHAAHLIIDQAASILHTDSSLSESGALTSVIKQHFSSQLTHPREIEQREEIEEPTVNSSYELASWNKLNQLLELYFDDDTDIVSSECDLTELTDAVHTQLKEQHLQSTPSLVNKIQQLHLCLRSSKCVLLSGVSGSGKTMTYSTLASTYQYIRELRALGKSAKPYKAQDNARQSEEYPSVDITVLNPAAYTLDELFGYYECERGEDGWRDGILTRMIRHLESLEEGKLTTPTSASQDVVDSCKCDSVLHWIVLDGPLDSVLMEVLVSLTSGQGLCLSNGDTLHLPGCCRVLVETTSLADLSPSLLAHSPLIYFSGGVLTYDTLIDTWLDRAPTRHNLSAMSTETLANIMKHLLPETLEYLNKTNTKCLGTSYSLWTSSQTYGLTETQSFLNFLSAVLERNSPKVEASVTHTGMASRSSRLSSRMESRASSALLSSYSSASMQLEYSNVSMTISKTSVNMEGGEPLDTIPDDLSECNLDTELGFSLQFQMASMLTFAYIWSLGAFCPFSELSSFSDFAREMIGGYVPFDMSLPEEGSVFDYYLNLSQYKFVPWTERKKGGSVSATGYVSIPELDRYTYIIDLYLSYGFNVMILGDKGSGKSSLVENLLRSRLPLTRLPITPTLTATQLQNKILTRVNAVEKRAAGQRISHRGSTNKFVFFLDDVHLAQLAGNVSTVLELTQFVSTHRQLYDYTRNYQHTLSETRFISSCTPEGYWKLSSKFSRVFNTVPFLPPSDDCLRQIFSSSVLQWLQAFPDNTVGNAEALAEALGTASVTVFRSLSGKIHPSPSHPHLSFSLHDFLHVYEGLLLLSPDTKTQSHPQFSLLNRRGFLSSVQTDHSSRRKSSNKQKKLPSLNAGQSQLKSRRRARGGGSVASSQSDNAQAQSTIRMVIRLWCHETTRVYLDRIVESKDRIWFTKLLEVCIRYCYCGDDLSGSSTKNQQRQLGGTASYGSRRVRGGSMRGGGQSSHHEGPSLEELAKAGVRVEVLQQLLPPGIDGLNKLLPMDQVTMKGEDLTGLMFAQFPVLPASSEENLSGSEEAVSDSTLPNYSELGDGQVMDILKRHIDNGSGETERLVLFKGAIEHSSRLCRAMSLVGTHTMFIGSKGCGRKTLVRLMAGIFNAKLYEVCADVDERVSEAVLTTLRSVCVSAAVDCQPTVLLVSNTDTLTAQDWEKVQLLMETGLCPGLFSSSELLVMSSKLQKGRMKKTTDGAQQMFAKAVQKRLHVFIVWDINNESLFSATERGDHSREERTRAVFSSLCHTCSYINRVTSWTKQEFSDIALRWWQHGFDSTGDSDHLISWQDWADTSTQLEAVATLATHVHLTSSELLSRIHGSQASTLISLKLFIEVLRIAQDLAIQFKAKEKIEESCLERALEKLSEMDRTVYELEQQLGVLRPQLALAEQEVQQRMNQITTAKQKYMAANERCKKAEDTIKSQTGYVEHYSKLVEEKFNEVSPVYYSALDALSSVEKNDVLELMSYRTPPDVLTPVFDALCMLFDRDPTWEDCKLLLLSPNFFENLKFFDKDNVPKQKLQCLSKMIKKYSKFESLSAGSQAVVSLCSWLNALIDYHHTQLTVKPFRESLAEAEKTLFEANKTFVEMRRDMMETKTELEETVKVHKESVQKQRAVEAQIESICSKLEHASHLLSAMSKQRRKWEEKLTAIRGKINSLPGHAVLCSAAVCYLSRVPSDKHSDLLSSWLGYCNGSVSLGQLSESRGAVQSAQQGYQVHAGQQQVVRIQKDFSVAGHLSEKAERAVWEPEGIFPDQALLERALSIRHYCRAGSSSWPLIFDPFSQFKDYLTALEGQSNTGEAQGLGTSNEVSQFEPISQVDVLDAQLVEKLSRAMSNGDTVTVLIKSVVSVQESSESTNFLAKVFKRAYFRQDDQLFLDSLCSVPIHNQFKLFVVVEASLEDVVRSSTGGLVSLCGSDWSALFIAELGLSNKGLQSYLQKLVLKYKRPEYSIRYKSLLTDLTLHHQQLENNERAIIDCMIDTETPLLELDNLLTTIQESEASDVSTLELIHETNKNIRAFDQQSLPYKSLSEYSSLLYTCVQTVRHSCQYFQFPLSQFKSLFSEVLLHSSNKVKVPDNLMAINAHVLYLKNQLLLAVCSALKVHLFERHQLLLLLLVGLESLKQQGKVTVEEMSVLGRALLSSEGQVDLSSPSDSTPANSKQDPVKPLWLSDESWCAALQLQKSLPSFRRLSTEIVNHSSQWLEYLKSSPSLLTPVPGYGDNCSVTQKLLLWRVLQPEMFPEAIKDFILLTFGADFSKTDPCSFTTILPNTSPATPTLVYFSTPVEFTNSLEPVHSEVYTVSLIDEEHLVSLESRLSDLLQDGCWIVVDNLQLCTNPSKMITLLAKKLETLSQEVCAHPDFRVWVPLPLDVFIATDLGPGVAFDGPKDKTGVYSSRNDPLIRDLQAVISHATTKDGGSKANAHKWENYSSLVLKLRDFIPTPFSPPDLTELDPHQTTSESIPPLIFEELASTNNVLNFLRSSLQSLQDCLAGRLPFTDLSGSMLTALSNNAIPQDWTIVLSADHGFPNMLISALKLLRERFSFYASILQSRTIPSEFSPLLISRPSDLISRTLLSFARDHQLHPGSVSVQAQVLHRPEDAPMREPSCLVFKDLLLHGAAALDSDGGWSSGGGGVKCWVAVYCEEQANKRTMNCPVLTRSVFRFSFPLAKELQHSVRDSIHFTSDYVT